MGFNSAFKGLMRVKFCVIDGDFLFWFQVAQKFYTLLVLKKHVVLELYQESSYDDIMITRGAKFDNPSL